MTTIRVLEFAEVLDVSHQRAGKIVVGPSCLAAVGREGRSRLWDRSGVHASKRWRREKPGASQTAATSDLGRRAGEPVV
jgi:hypothetical protein